MIRERRTQWEKGSWDEKPWQNDAANGRHGLGQGSEGPISGVKTPGAWRMVPRGCRAREPVGSDTTQPLRLRLC